MDIQIDKQIYKQIVSPESTTSPITFSCTFGTLLKKTSSKHMKTSSPLETCRKNLQGMIHLIPKSGGSANDISKWQPITLLNIVYKMLAKIVASRCRVNILTLCKKIDNEISILDQISGLLQKERCTQELQTHFITYQVMRTRKLRRQGKQSYDLSHIDRKFKALAI